MKIFCFGPAWPFFGFAHMHFRKELFCCLSMLFILKPSLTIFEVEQKSGTANNDK